MNFFFSLLADKCGAITLNLFLLSFSIHGYVGVIMEDVYFKSNFLRFSLASSKKSCTFAPRLGDNATEYKFCKEVWVSG